MILKTHLFGLLVALVAVATPAFGHDEAAIADEIDQLVFELEEEGVFDSEESAEKFRGGYICFAQVAGHGACARPHAARHRFEEVARVKADIACMRMHRRSCDAWCERL